MTDEVAAAKERLGWYLDWYHRCTIDDVEITDTPGYWRRKKPCGPECHEPIHGCLGNEGRIQHTIRFYDEGRVRGRFASPTRTWRTLRCAEEHSSTTRAMDGD